MGESWAIPTMDWQMQPLPLDAIRNYIDRFIAYTRLYPEKQFLVTAIGCGIAGFTADQISPLFADAPANCTLPDGWRK